MTVKKFPLKLLSSIVAIGFSSAAFAALPSLSSLYLAAQKHDPAYQATNYKIQADLDQSKVLSAAILPQIGLGINSTRTVTAPNGMPVQGFNGTKGQIQLSQPLYDGSAWANYESSKLGKPMADLAQKVADQNLIVKVSSAYFEVIKAVNKLVVTNLQKKAALNQLAQAQKNFEVGTATITDSRIAQAAADQSAAEEIAATNDLAVKRLALEQITGIRLPEITDAVKPAIMPKMEPTNVQEWVDMGVSDNPSIAQAKLALTQSDYAVDKAEAGHKPTVDLVASYAESIGTAPDNPMGIKSNQSTIGLSVKIPIFAGFAIQNQVKQAVSMQYKARSDLDNATQLTEQAVRATFAGVSSGLAAVSALKAAELSAKSALDASELSYKVGVGTNTDVINQQSKYYQVMNQLSDTRFSVLQSYIQLYQATGTLKFETLNTVDKSLGF